MTTRTLLLGLAAAALLSLGMVGPASAARVRYHYVASAGQGTMNLQPQSPSGAPGERLTWAARWEPYNCPPRPTTCVAYRHCRTGQQITVPLALPLDSTPRIEYRNSRVIYDYGTDTVEVDFLVDGSVNVIYSSGLFRAP